MEEQRKYQRFDIQLLASFSGNGAAGGGLVTNLSREGCSIASEEPVRPATSLALRLRLPEQHSPLRVDVAEVQWTGAGGFGLQFIRLRPEEQEQLHRFISVLEASQYN